MLETLRIQNFKSWQDTGDIAFGSLTGFFGTNSSGKSSILQFLLMLKQTVESSDRSRVLHLGDDKSYVDLGTMYDIIHQHEDPGRIIFTFSWLPSNVDYDTNYFEQTYNWKDYQLSLFDNNTTTQDQLTKPSLNFSAEIARAQDHIWIKSIRYQSKTDTIGVKRIDTNKVNSANYEVYISNNKTSIINSNFIRIASNKFYLLPPIPNRYLSKLADEFVFKLEELFDNSFYLGPLREYPRKFYSWAGDKPQGVGDQGEDAIAALLSSRNEVPTIDIGLNHPKRTVEEHVAHWLKELGLIYSFKVQPIAPNRKEYEVRIQRTAESASVFLTDVGFGVSQILPVLVLLFYVPEGSTVILEQPEIHLHPAVQAGLADVFIDAIKRRKLQIILESHSEHLLQRLQRRMAEFTLNPEKAIDPEVINLYFTSIKEGRSELTTLDLDEYGNIRNWPDGFFGNAFEEAAAKMKAEMKRKMQQQ